ncbi:Rho GTPase activation protein [Rhizopus microsporus var. microsporus]|uniref:Rho GTPase activation protein n=2 Tax=Rhizopus microsporus TaxID=58291 RepID=A0A2G4SGM0_RHIZD|nr:Rho GTPase activation protein [Rhizopus microsporus ATCC 52813]ORE11077.1 Rho GTPase activation protein [Rhizopus microsporus var. microsporus]PHZ07918.1 Rho GTPase activation protein [Rhizopus microsporus ATCC 52813]
MDIDSNNKDSGISIKSWWKKFTHLSKQVIPKEVEDHIFGVPLEESVQNAKATIGYADNGIQYIGFIPVIVAKCGSFLKDQGLYTEGVFRVSGSAKRIGELQQIFSTAPDYGRGLDWKGYSIHDAATVLRRYLNYLPEPVIVPSLYQAFRDTLNLDNETKTVEQYQYLIGTLPLYNQYLLFYLLDLMALFAQHAHTTKMDAFNLAAVFTPGILLDPDNSLHPAQYKLSQKVVQFLVEHQHCFKMPKSAWLPTSNQDMSQPTVQTRPPPLPLHISGPAAISDKTDDDMDWSPIDKSGKIKRSKTMPTKPSRYGLNDPLQVIQLNKS